MLLIGSRAVAHHLPDFRCPKDYDLIATFDEFIAWVRANKSNIKYKRIGKSGKVQIRMVDRNIVEVEFATPNSSSMRFIEINCGGHEVEIPGGIAKVASLSSIVAIKRSHLHHSIHWQKNMEDYHFLRKLTNLSVEERKAQKLRSAEIDERMSRRKIVLSKSNEEFFAQSDKVVNRIYEHDDLHLATCYYDRPLYESLKPDLSKAFLSHLAFKALSEENKNRLLLEEGYAIALERSLIPALENNETIDDQRIRLSLADALKRICTNLTQGWFREYAIEHYFDALDSACDFLGKFQSAVALQKIVRL